MARVQPLKKRQPSAASQRKPRRSAGRPENADSALENMRTVDREKLPAALLAILDEHRYVVRLLKILNNEATQLLQAKS